MSELQQFLTNKLNHQDLLDLLKILIDIPHLEVNRELTKAIDYSLAEKENETMYCTGCGFNVKSVIIETSNGLMHKCSDDTMCSVVINK